ncbi:hypothetical protein DZC34_06590 [Clostridium botulinum]|nr:hypothetical protein DZC34_06590 [Clostridium botulinum]
MWIKKYYFYNFYAIYGGTKTVGKLNEIIFFLTIIIFFIPLVAIKDGNIMNLKPFLGNGVLNIIKGVKETVFSYTQIEMILLMYPFLKDSNKIKKCGLKSIIFITFMLYMGELKL